MSSLRVLACAALLAAGPPALGELYKWTDERGVTHYSDKPPAAGKATRLPDAAPAVGGSTGKSWQELDEEFRARQHERDSAQRRAQEERSAQEAADLKRRGQCRAAYAQKDLFAGRKLVWRYTERGEKVLMSDAERDAEIERLDRFIAQNCRF